MNYQDIGVLTVSLLIIMTEGVFLACGGFETIKKAMQAAGGAIWRMISWPWRLWKNHKREKWLERQWLDYINQHKLEILDSLMKTTRKEMSYKQFTTKEAVEGLAEAMEMIRKAETSTEDIKTNEEERTWRENFMKRFMTKT